MVIRFILRLIFLSVIILLFAVIDASAQSYTPYKFSFATREFWSWFLPVLLAILLIVCIALKNALKTVRNSYKEKSAEEEQKNLKEYTKSLNSDQIEKLLHYKQTNKWGKLSVLVPLFILGLTILPSGTVSAQITGKNELLSETGILITIFLLLIPIIVGVVLVIIKVRNVLFQYKNKQALKEAEKLAEYLQSLPEEEVSFTLMKRKKALDYQLTHHELSGDQQASDDKGLLQINIQPDLPIVALKKKAIPRPNIDPALTRLIIWYFGCSAFWLLFGTTIGEYIGIKFVAPDADHISWLSFGRLRPVHTNAVFWGWASLGMLGLGYYVVPRVSNVSLASIRTGWWSLFLINAAVLLGSLCLMAGINNGGGEYREYIWPVMLLFGLGLVLTLSNFLRTIGRRTTREIYIYPIGI